MLTREETWQKLVDLNIVYGDIKPLPWNLSWPVQDGEADLVRAFRAKAHLQYRDLSGTNLSGSNLNQSNCTETDLAGADLSCCNFQGADFSRTILRGANLREADLRRSILQDTDFQGANLSGALLQHSSMISVNLAGANLSGCKVFGISTWGITTNESTLMRDLVISQDNEKLLTVDDIEVAQFIYMLIQNKKLSSVIDTMRTKAILILGSFDDKSMVVLEILKNAIRGQGLLPLFFDFRGPHTQDLMETVRTMALLSRCVIVDLSIRSGQLHELADIVRNTYIPIVTIAENDTQTTPMQNEFVHYYWYRNKYFPYCHQLAAKQIPELLKNEILPWVQLISDKIMKTRMQNNDKQ